MAIGLSILEQEDALKNLPTQALQGLMGQPSPQVPPFMVAAELKRREEMAKQFAGKEAATQTAQQAPTVAARLAGRQQPVPMSQAGAMAASPPQPPMPQGSQLAMAMSGATGQPPPQLPTVNARTGTDGAAVSELVAALRREGVGTPSQGSEHKPFASRERPDPVSPRGLALLIAALKEQERQRKEGGAYAGFEIPRNTPSPKGRGGARSPARPVAMAADGTQGRTVYAQEGSSQALVEVRKAIEQADRLQALSAKDAAASEGNWEGRDQRVAARERLRLLGLGLAGNIPVAVGGLPQVDSRSNEYYPTPQIDMDALGRRLPLEGAGIMEGGPNIPGLTSGGLPVAAGNQPQAERPDSLFATPASAQEWQNYFAETDAATGPSRITLPRTGSAESRAIRLGQDIPGLVGGGLPVAAGNQPQADDPRFPAALSSQEVPRLLGASNVGRSGAPPQVGGLADSGIMEEVPNIRGVTSGGVPIAVGNQLQSAQRFISGEEGRVEEAPVADPTALKVSEVAGVTEPEIADDATRRALQLSYGPGALLPPGEKRSRALNVAANRPSGPYTSRAPIDRARQDAEVAFYRSFESRFLNDPNYPALLEKWNKDQTAFMREHGGSNWEQEFRKRAGLSTAKGPDQVSATPPGAAAAVDVNGRVSLADAAKGLSPESRGWPPVVSAGEATPAAVIKFANALPKELPAPVTSATDATVAAPGGVTTASLSKELVSLEKDLGADAPSARQETDNYLATLNKRSDQIRSDLKGGLAELAKADAKDFKEYETRFKALDEYHKTGKLPERMRQDRITNLMLEMSKALLGNQNLYDAFKEGVAGFQTVDKAAREKYADDLAAMLTASKGMVDSKMAIRNARRQESIAMTRFAAEQNRGNATLAQDNLKIAEQARQNVRANKISLLRNRIQIRQAEIALAAVRKRTEAERVMDRVVGPLYQQARAEAQAGDRARLDKYFFINAEGQPAPRELDIYNAIKSSGGAQSFAAANFNLKLKATSASIAKEARNRADKIMGSFRDSSWVDIAGRMNKGVKPTVEDWKNEDKKAAWMRMAVEYYKSIDPRSPNYTTQGGNKPDPIGIGPLPPGTGS